MTDEYNESTYGNRISEIYDSWYPEAPREMIAVLQEMAGPGPALELGIGSGRIALALAERGVDVHGIDASEAMVEKLRAKPGGDRLPVTIGNFSDVAVNEQYSLVFVVFNTFFAMSSQDEQVRCFANVAARLRPGGRFLIEAFVPDLTRFSRGAASQVIGATHVNQNEVRLEATRHDQLTQRLTSQHIVIDGTGIKLYPVQLRYAWPSELDLMARLARMRLLCRWGNWRRDPFTADSSHHVSIYELQTS